ncbi:MAG: 50S ribosomal protein L4 [Acidimicrobiia bacterium]|nr:50S ribosomal protein L4 [Acidimicrobiia bacterium]
MPDSTTAQTEIITAPLFGADGTSMGEVDLDSAVFGVEPNRAVLHQVITAQLAGARSGTASVKTRGEVRGGGRKPWRQKGLGRARHGSIRSPHWMGGGVAHGPKPRSYAQRTPKKMKRLALRSALSARASEKAVLVIDSFDWTEPKTKNAASLLAKIGLEGKTVLVVDRLDDSAALSFRNLSDVVLVEPGHLTAYDVLWSDRVVLTSSTVNRVGGARGTYDVSDSDFVREDDEDAIEPADDGGEEE